MLQNFVLRAGFSCSCILHNHFLIKLLTGRNKHSKHRAFARSTFHTDFASVKFYIFAHNVQSYTRSGMMAVFLIFDAVKTLKNAIYVAARNANPCIGDVDFQIFAIVVELLNKAELQVDFSAFGCKLKSIRKQVVHNFS